MIDAAGTVPVGYATKAAGAGTNAVMVRLIPGLGVTVTVAEAAFTKH